MVMDSPYKPTEPAIFFIKGHGPPSWINIKVRSTASMNETLPKIEAVFKKIIPSAPFEYQFVDDTYALKFAAEERIGRLSFVFGTLAIFISCLGLFGLASFVAEQRTKEIGIRKVLGATVANLCSMLSKEFVLLVILSCLISIPIAWYFLNGWLEKYPYRIEISAWTFIATSTAAVLITLMTVSYEAVKAALMNPVNSLRSE